MSGSGLPTARLQGGEVLRAVSLGHSISDLGAFRQKILPSIKGGPQPELAGRWGSLSSLGSWDSEKQGT